MALLKKFAASASLVVLATASLSVPVLAHSSTDTSESGSTNSGTSSVRSSTESGSSGSGRALRTVTSTSGETETEHETELKTEFQNRAKQQVDDLKKTAKQKTQAARETSCNERKNGAEQRITSISTNTARFQTKLDNIFTKTQAYVTDKNLTVQNYDALVAAVTTAQTASADSITTLKGLQPTIDCTKDTNAQNVAAFRTAAQDARDKLKTYMKSLKELLKAVRDAKQAAQTQTNTNTSTEGSTN